MIVGRGGTTAISDLSADPGLAGIVNSQRTLEECKDSRAAPRGRPAAPVPCQNLIQILDQVFCGLAEKSLVKPCVEFWHSTRLISEAGLAKIVSADRGILLISWIL